MPVITNTHGLPQAIVEAVKSDPYDKGDADFSVTGLIGPPQISRLWERHHDEIEIDVSEEIWRLLGRGVHSELERAGHGVTEKRLFAEHDGVTISGAIDVRDDGVLQDWKVTSVWSVKFGVKPEWEAQLNLYRWLCSENDIDIHECKINMILRDWIKSQSKVKANYPPIPFHQESVSLWTFDEIRRYLTERIEIHTQEETASCTDEERWMRKDGTPVRCMDWCAVAPFCPQYNQSKGE